MYLLALIIPYCIAYFVIAWLFSYFFDQKRPTFHTAPWRSLIMIISFVLTTLAIIFLIPDAQWQNRVEHALGGGFLVTLICLWAVRDTRVPVTRFHFFIFTLLLVTSLGVVNELFEFFLQTHTSIIASDNPFDTWRDLTSNTIGIIAALTIATPLLHARRSGESAVR